MSLIQIASEHRRISILRFLWDSPEYTSNSSILTDVVNRLGVPSTRVEVEQALEWLEQAELIETTGAKFVVRILDKGCEVAAGRLTVPGVRRPTIGR